MKVPVCAMGDLPCFTKGDNDSQPEDEVSLDSNEEENDNNTQSQPRNPTTSSLDRNVAAGDWVSKSVRGKGGLCLLFFIFSRFSLVCGESFRHSVYGDFIHKSTSSCLLRLLHIDLFPDPKLVRRFHLKKVCVHLSCMRRTNLLWVWNPYSQSSSYVDLLNSQLESVLHENFHKESFHSSINFGASEIPPFRNPSL
ncbi:hypothetical protein YC2023_118625 [Brassica napus]